MSPEDRYTAEEQLLQLYGAVAALRAVVRELIRHTADVEVVERSRLEGLALADGARLLDVEDRKFYVSGLVESLNEVLETDVGINIEDYL